MLCVLEHKLPLGPVLTRFSFMDGRLTITVDLSCQVVYSGSGLGVWDCSSDLNLSRANGEFCGERQSCQMLYIKNCNHL